MDDKCDRCGEENRLLVPVVTGGREELVCDDCYNELNERGAIEQ